MSLAGWPCRVSQHRKNLGLARFCPNLKRRGPSHHPQDFSSTWSLFVSRAAAPRPVPSTASWADKRARRDGSFIERIGFYNPGAAQGEEGLRIAQDRLTHWLGVGAQPSLTVQRLIKQAAKAAVAAA